MQFIPWDSILKFIFTITLMIIEKVKERDELRKEFLKFIAIIQTKTDTPIKLKNEYEELMSEIRKDLANK